MILTFVSKFFQQIFAANTSDPLFLFTCFSSDAAQGVLLLFCSFVSLFVCFLFFSCRILKELNLLWFISMSDTSFNGVSFCVMTDLKHVRSRTHHHSH